MDDLDEPACAHAPNAQHPHGERLPRFEQCCCAPLLELLREMRSVLELPIVTAGGVAEVASAQPALEAGPDAVACGTAFLVAHEADVHPNYLDRLLPPAVADTVLTTVFDLGWPDAPHRVVRTGTFVNRDAAGRRPRGAAQWGRRGRRYPGRSPIVRYSDAQPTSSTAGEIDAMALYAGTSVGHVRQCASAREISEALARALT